jgi:beta-glucosidase
MFRSRTRYVAFSFIIGTALILGGPQSSGIYGSWIDLNKNGRMDPYEDPSVQIDKRIDDLLSQMTLEEKTAQMATLYGYGRAQR